ncbi:replicative DNA helicase [Mycoplasma procyoni]|uniref:replicative DNA helicase n=1 Tax=Mycoplasma procyoni TaxID=568784 RepID=UPI00197C2479|nr:replicative DNA helicase [Mycoplasma procyoni]MBN3534460.1 replicative DNA helicase [Mycoplasma procyoni]
MNNINLHISEEAEQSILNYIISTEENRAKIIPFLEKEDFYFSYNQIIFEAIEDLFNNAKEISLVTITNELHRLNILQKAGGAVYIASIGEANVPLFSTVNDFMTELVEKSNLRKAKVALDFAQQQIAQQNKTADEVLNEFESKMVQISRGTEQKDFAEIRVVAEELLKDLLARRSEDGIKGISTGIKSLDKITSGLQRGDLIILAARPAMGKTAFALNIAKNVAEQEDKVVVFFSLEMPSIQLVTRILSADSAVEAYHLKNPQYITDAEWVKISNSLKNRISKYNLFLADSGGIKLHEMVWKTKKLLTKMKKIDLIVVDYLQLVNVGSGQGNGNRQLEVSTISRTLKQLARDINCPILALAQLSREVEKREDKKPIISDLRDSGAIEQDADIVTFLYRENYYTKEVSPTEVQETQLIIAKHRNGAIGEITLQFDAKIGLFFEEDKEF